MIRDIEIKEMAREYGVPETTIEKDYALNWILRALYQQTELLALKGGTGLRKVFFNNYRFSEDLDFTMLRSTEISELEKTIKKAVQTAKRDSGINFQDTVLSEENINGYKLDIYFSIFRRGGNPLRIKFDITKPEKEIMILPLVKKQVFHPDFDMIFNEVIDILAGKINTQKTPPSAAPHRGLGSQPQRRE